MSVNDLRITEVMYNPGPSGLGYIEITNTGGTSVNTSEFFVGNSDFLPEYYQNGFGPTVDIPAGATVVLVPSLPNNEGEVFEPPVPISQAEFEAVYGPLPAGAVYFNYPAFFAPIDGNLLMGGTTYTIGGLDVYADSIYIPAGAAEGQSVSVDSSGNATIGAPTPGSTGVAPPAGPTDGDDVLIGGDEPVTLDLMGGDDIWTGVSNPEVFVAGQYTDSILGGLGNDSIYSGIGNDKIDGGKGDDLLDLGDGNDKAWGGSGNDELFGGTGSDRLNGNSGDDDIYGGKGGDIIRGGKGEDFINGGGQSDRIYGGAQSDEIYGDLGNDTIYGDEGADLIFGGYGDDTIDGGSFDDIIHGDHGRDKITGGAGADEIYGGVDNDILNGNSGDDLMFGDTGIDNMKGGSGNDALFGGADGDRLNGGDGNDILNGGAGDDTLTGESGADVFVFSGMVGSDLVTDFEVGVDRIDVTGYGPISDADALAAVSQVGADVVVDLGANGEVVLQGIALEDLSLSDFIYLPDDIFIVG